MEICGDATAHGDVVPPRTVPRAPGGEPGGEPGGAGPSVALPGAPPPLAPSAAGRSLSDGKKQEARTKNQEPRTKNQEDVYDNCSGGQIRLFRVQGLAGAIRTPRSPADGQRSGSLTSPIFRALVKQVVCACAAGDLCMAVCIFKLSLSVFLFKLSL